MSSNEADGGVKALARLIASDPVIGPQLTTWITEGVARPILAAGYLSPEQAAARERQAGAAVLREAADALRKRLDDWLRSTSETYAQPVGSPAWRDGLVGYLMRGPGSLADVRAERLEAGDE